MFASISDITNTKVFATRLWMAVRSTMWRLSHLVLALYTSIAIIADTSNN